MSKKNGFTLAEVLITIGVIGIVAAMTLPSLVGKYKEKQRVSQLKKAYSVLSQAFLSAKLEYGDPRDWGLTTSQTGKTDEEGNEIIDRTGKIRAKEIFGKYIKQSKGKNQHQFRSHISLDGKNYNSDGSTELTSPDSTLFLADGTMVTFGWVYNDCNSDARCGDVVVFLPEKTAQNGVSQFWFYLAPEGIIPYGHEKYTNRPFEKYCDRKNSSGLNANNQGRGCTAWVLYNENMDYLHCDGLSWDGKTKCN